MKKGIDISSDHLALVQQILQKHLSLLSNVKVYAFGSRVKHTAKKYSDLDLAIAADESLSLSILSKLADEFEESILPFKVDLVDWQTISEDFKNLIKEDCEIIAEF